MRTILFATLPCLALLGGCVSESSPGAVAVSTSAGMTEKVYVRADGKRLSTNPALTEKLEIDKTVCRGEAQKVGLVAKNTIESRNLALQMVNAGIKESKISDVMQGCMAEHGYMYMTVAEAEARADALAAGGPKRKKKLRTAMN